VVPTMSSTLAPRDRSLIGRANACSNHKHAENLGERPRVELA